MELLTPQKKIANKLSLNLMFFLCLILTFAFVVNVKRLVVPLFISYLLILITRPITRFLKRWSVSSTWTAVFVVILLEFCFFYPIFMLTPVVIEQSHNLELYIPRISEYLNVFYQKADKKIYDFLGIKLKINYLDMSINYAQGELKSLLLKVPNMVAVLLEWIFLIPIFVFFLIKDYQTFLRASLKLVPNGVYEKVYNLIFKFHHKVGDYIFAKFIEAFILGMICTLVLYTLDVEFSLLFGLIIAVTNIIPYVGPLIGALPPIVFALAEYGTTPKTLSLVVLLSLANLVDMAIIFPILVSKIVDLHPFIVIMSVILGSQYFGIVGMVVSIPIASIIKLMFDEFQKELYSSMN